MNALEVDALSVSYGTTQVLHGVSFALAAGETVAVVGESGSGKTTLANAIQRLLPGGVSVTGRIRIAGQEVDGLDHGALRALRVQHIGYVPQDPANSLNPVRTIRAQVRESLAVIASVRRRDVEDDEVTQALTRAGLQDPEHLLDRYPHELSGGMLQRVLIAMATCGRPTLLIADEPTSALDVTVQRSILDLLTRQARELSVATLLVTHDLALAAERATSVLVLREGVVQEFGPVAEVLSRPTSGYTAQLLADVPAAQPDRFVSTRRAAQADADESRPPALELRGVRKEFGRGDTAVTALAEVDVTVRTGTTHALVGESGSGKTTAARIALRLERQDAGEVLLGGHRVEDESPRALAQIRRDLQLVYQNPFTSLDPRYTVAKLIEEPLIRHRIGTRAERRDRVATLLDDVGLAPSLAAARPTRLSGGQRQRVAIARALAINPKVLVLDEPTSALDVTVQARILELLVRLQAEHRLTYLFVSHDLGVVRQLADDVTVLRAGRVVEQGPADSVLNGPEHQYTADLLAAVPGRSVFAGGPPAIAPSNTSNTRRPS